MTGSQERKGRRDYAAARFKEIKEHVCRYCGVRCASAGDLMVHIRTCDGEQEP